MPESSNTGAGAPRTIDTVGDALPREMARIRDEVIPVYQSIGSAGGFAIAMMKQDLDAAAKALATGDVVEMMRCLAELKGYEL